MTPLEALEQARAAWEKTQPQLRLELWPDELGEAPPSRGGAWQRRLPEPARPRRHLQSSVPRRVRLACRTEPGDGNPRPRP